MNADIEDLLRAGQLEKVEIGLIEAELDLRAATQHLASARQIYLTDPLGSFQLAYDSARKCLQGLLALEGIRVRKPPRGQPLHVRVGQSFSDCRPRGLATVELDAGTQKHF